MRDIKKLPFILEKASVAQCSDYWKLRSAEISKSHPSNEFIFHEQYNAKVRKWLPLALYALYPDLGSMPGDLDEARERAGKVPLRVLLQVSPQALAQEAKAQFIVATWNKSLDGARSLRPSELGLARKDARRANAVTEAVWRFLRFFRTFAASSKTALIESKWPAPPTEYHYQSARALYNRIRVHGLANGVLDPAEMSPEQVRDAFIFEEKAVRSRDVRKYRREAENLKKAVEVGLLTAFTSDQLALLEVPKAERKKAPSFTVAEFRLAELWPDHFSLDSGNPKKVCWKSGLPGFFNKTLMVPPYNPAGQFCNSKNRLHRKPMEGRLSAIRRYVRRQLEKNPALTFAECFAPERIYDWLRDMVEAAGEPSAFHKSEYDHILMVALHYLSLDVGALCKRVAATIQFPKDWENGTGDRAVRDGSYKTLLEQADSFACLAASSRLLSDKSGNKCDSPATGVYLVRKSCQIDVLLRIHTGFRPICIDDLTVADAPDRKGASPTIWKDAGGKYVIFVPLRWLKQLLAQIQGRDRSRIPNEAVNDTEVPGIEFKIQRRETIDALDEYLAFGWRYAKGVVEGRTRRLLLNCHGEAFGPDGFGTAFGTCKIEASHFMKRTTDRDIKRHNRKAHRAIIGCAVDMHCPGHQLKSRYLTHSGDYASDGFYSQANMSFLSDVIDELLSGKPSRPDQARQRENERDKLIADLSAKVDRLLQLEGR